MSEGEADVSGMAWWDAKLGSSEVTVAAFVVAVSTSPAAQNLTAHGSHTSPSTVPESAAGGGSGGGEASANVDVSTVSRIARFVVCGAATVVARSAWALFLHRFGPFQGAMGRAAACLFTDVPNKAASVGGGEGAVIGGALVPWFHGCVSRSTAETLLSGSPEGTFLLRFSENFPTLFTLVYLKKVDGRLRMKHCLVYNLGSRGYALKPERKLTATDAVFPSIAAFVRANPAILKFPCNSALYHMCVTERAEEMARGGGGGGRGGRRRTEGAVSLPLPGVADSGGGTPYDGAYDLSLGNQQPSDDGGDWDGAGGLYGRLDASVAPPGTVAASVPASASSVASSAYGVVSTGAMPSMSGMTPTSAVSGSPYGAADMSALSGLGGSPLAGTPASFASGSPSASLAASSPYGAVDATSMARMGAPSQTGMPNNSAYGAVSAGAMGLSLPAGGTTVTSTPALPGSSVGAYGLATGSALPMPTAPGSDGSAYGAVSVAGGLSLPVPAAATTNMASPTIPTAGSYGMVSGYALPMPTTGTSPYGAVSTGVMGLPTAPGLGSGMGGYGAVDARSLGLPSGGFASLSVNTSAPRGAPSPYDPASLSALSGLPAASDGLGAYGAVGAETLTGLPGSSPAAAPVPGSLAGPAVDAYGTVSVGALSATPGGGSLHSTSNNYGTVSAGTLSGLPSGGQPAVSLGMPAPAAPGGGMGAYGAVNASTLLGMPSSVDAQQVGVPAASAPAGGLGAYGAVNVAALSGVPGPGGMPGVPAASPANAYDPVAVDTLSGASLAAPTVSTTPAASTAAGNYGVVSSFELHAAPRGGTPPAAAAMSGGQTATQSSAYGVVGSWDMHAERASSGESKSGELPRTSAVPVAKPYEPTSSTLLDPTGSAGSKAKRYDAVQRSLLLPSSPLLPASETVEGDASYDLASQAALAASMPAPVRGTYGAQQTWTEVGGRGAKETDNLSGVPTGSSVRGLAPPGVDASAGAYDMADAAKMGLSIEPRRVAPGEVKSKLDAGIAAFRESNLEEAGRLFQETVSLARMAGEKLSEARALANLASVHKKQGGVEHAIDWYTESARLLKELGDDRKLASVLKSLVDCCQHVGMYGHALQYARIRLGLCSETERPTLLLEIASLERLAGANK